MAKEDKKSLLQKQIERLMREVREMISAHSIYCYECFSTDIDFGVHITKRKLLGRISCNNCDNTIFAVDQDRSETNPPTYELVRAAA